ncbi:MAG TPA: XRE family transcriptional regulator [Desulfonatronum sp.]|nr:XRE family transcriptional regulator [Desulfonatronum sp.]
MPGVCLRAARTREGITQAKLSGMTGIPQRHISEMENGKRPVGRKTAQAIAKALNMDHRVFL